ncbi:organic cation transporter protein-like isoform X1 [Choristoneura fumiferana]|uniref:organic cation transporter protein-like isoform X1 n=2 Tax=Choristoneura fumiferana TaxID=7141 RepID=UPI003D15A813
MSAVASKSEPQKIGEMMLDNDTKDAENQKVSEDPLTRAIGAIGKWQIWICFVVFLVKFPVAWHQMSIIFLAPPMNFTCADTPSDIFDNTCHANCTNYEYDHSIFSQTIISQWNLVCERQWLKNLTQTFFMLGILVGNMVFGHLSDRFGRRMPFLAAVFLQLISGVATAYSVNWYMFTALRFMLAVATGGTMVTSFVLTMELIGAKYRETVGIIYQIPFNLGHLMLPMFGYYLRDWDKFQLAISLPSIIFLSYYFLLPESPRWLLTTGRTDEAVKIMTVAAKRNGRPTDNIAATTQKMCVDVGSAGAGEHASFLALFRTPRLRTRTLAICFNWFVCGLCFFGVSQYIGQVSGNIFTNVAISAAIQVPGTLISIYANRVLGRKITLISSNCVTGLSCLLIIAVPHSGVAHLTLGCTGLWGMSISFATVYLYAGELFPTVVRNSGVGLSSTVARVGSMVAPFVATLSATSYWLPPLVFGIIPLVGAGLCILLPDTRGKKLPDTLEEGEK